MNVMPRRPKPEPLPPGREGLRREILAHAWRMVERLETPIGQNRLSFDSEALTLDQRIDEGDITSHRDTVAEFLELACPWIDRFDETIGMDAGDLERLTEVRAEKQNRGELRKMSKALPVGVADDVDAAWLADDEA
jgi:hypothetical protein